MKTPRVFIVVLRRPKLSDPEEKREDPFWEFGSFGSTGCHMKNLLNPKKAKTRLEGARLAFAQGGHLGFKLVKLTPPIRIDDSKMPCEALWSPKHMPFRYADAPLLVDHNGRSDFHFLEPRVRKGGCAGPVAQFSSIFRAAVTALPPRQARALVKIYESKLRKARGHMFAKKYSDALSYAPPLEETRQQRKRSYFAGLDAPQPRDRGMRRPGVVGSYGLKGVCCCGRLSAGDFFGLYFS